MTNVFSRLQRSFIDYYHSLSVRRKLLMAFLLVGLVPVGVLGLYAVSNSILTADSQADRLMADKLRIAGLVWNMRLEALENSARSVAQDNLVIMNLDLGLYSPFYDYLGELSRRDELDLAMVLDPQGRVLTRLGLQSVVGDTRILPERLLKLAGDKGCFVPVLVNDSELAAALGLTPDAGKPALALLNIQAIHNYGGSHTGYVVLGLALNAQDAPFTARFLARLRSEAGLPFLLAIGGELIHFSEGAADFPGIDAAAYQVGKGQRWRFGWQGSVYLGQFSAMGQLWSLDPLRDGQAYHLGIAFPEAVFFANRNIGILVWIGVIVLALGGAAVAGLRLARGISNPIVAVSESAREIIKGNFSVHVPVASSDEIGLMAEEFNIMTARLADTMERLAREVEEHEWAEREVRKVNDELEARVEARTHELTKSNEALAESLLMLRRTQKKLVESEKLAALGNLVAGLAHELNTPLGVSLTAASYLKTRHAAMYALLASNQITRQALAEFLETIEEASLLLTDNLSRTAEQIRFFKQIAVDQGGSASGEIELRDYLEEFGESMSHHLREGGHRFQNEVPPGLVVHTAPSPLYQVLSQLFMNAVHHAWEGRREGSMRCSAWLEGDKIHLVFADDGVGMAKDVLDHIFEPFFTTRRGTGRIGLGLSIVHNLVSVKLGGEISCRSAPGEGSEFHIILPREVGELPDLVQLDGLDLAD